MNLSYVILACIAPVALIILLMCGAPMANAKANAHSAMQKNKTVKDSVPVEEIPAPSTDQYAVRNDSKLDRINNYPRHQGTKMRERTEVEDTFTPFAKKKFNIYEDKRALNWSHVMRNPQRNLNDAQAKFHKFDKGEAANHMGNVEIRRAKPFIPKTERGDEESSLRVNGVRFQGQDYASRGVGKRSQTKPKRKRIDDRSRNNVSIGAGRSLAFPQRGKETLRPTKRNKVKGWEMYS